MQAGRQTAGTALQTSQYPCTTSYDFPVFVHVGFTSPSRKTLRNPQDALVEARNLFSMVDQDNSGKLDKSEVEYFLKTLKKVRG
jgi:hypothetical protein